jgi:hypothetical protein
MKMRVRRNAKCHPYYGPWLYLYLGKIIEVEPIYGYSALGPNLRTIRAYRQEPEGWIYDVEWLIGAGEYLNEEDSDV